MRIAKWDRWLDTLAHETQTITLSRHLYRGMAELLVDHPSLPRSIFWEFLEMWHAHSAVMAVRRQSKLDKQSISWIKLLTEMSENCSLLSRKWFRSLYEGSVVADTADRTFDKFSGLRGEHVRRQIILDDIAKLQSVAKKIERYADRIVAHRDKRKVTKLPRYTDIDTAVEFFEYLWKRYALVLRATSVMSALPILQHDWKLAFSVPWDGRAVTRS